jgi:hypothetical protein
MIIKACCNHSPLDTYHPHVNFTYFSLLMGGSDVRQHANSFMTRRIHKNLTPGTQSKLNPQHTSTFISMYHHRCDSTYTLIQLRLGQYSCFGIIVFLSAFGD